MDTQQFHDSANDRYQFDFRLCTPSRGWAQCDTSQDASYFGIWTNPFRHMLVTYAEGDTTIQRAANEAEYREAVRSAATFYREQGHGFAIDAMCRDQIITRLQALGLGDLLH